MNAHVKIQIYTYIFLATGFFGTIILFARRYVFGVAARAREFVALWLTCLVYWAVVIWLIMKHPENVSTGIFLIVLVTCVYAIWRRAKSQRTNATR